MSFYPLAFSIYYFKGHMENIFVSFGLIHLKFNFNQVRPEIRIGFILKSIGKFLNILFL